MRNICCINCGNYIYETDSVVCSMKCYDDWVSKNTLSNSRQTECKAENMIYRDYFCDQLHLTYLQACMQHNFFGKDGKFYSNCPPKELQIPWSDND